MMKRTASQRASWAQTAGKAFERSIESQQHGWPMLIKVPTLRNRRGTETGRVWLDYVGMRPGSGQLVTFDAKWIGEATRVRRSVLVPHQREWARLAHASGALVFVYVGAHDANSNIHHHIVPWGVLDEQVSLDLPPWRVWGLKHIGAMLDEQGHWRKA